MGGTGYVLFFGARIIDQEIITQLEDCDFILKNEHKKIKIKHIGVDELNWYIIISESFISEDMSNLNEFYIPENNQKYRAEINDFADTNNIKISENISWILSIDEVF
jgi:hypothetical protein